MHAILNLFHSAQLVEGALILRHCKMCIRGRVCGDDAIAPKPNPATLLLACEKTNIQPQSCWYVGDAERDIQAGKAAGMKTAVAMYGYLDVTDKPAEWGADAFIATPLEIVAALSI